MSYQGLFNRNNTLNTNMVNQRTLREEEKKEIGEVFDMFDIDRDGKLDVYQFGVALRALGIDIPKPALLNLSKDTNLFINHQIPRAIFQSFAEQQIRSKPIEQELEAAFKLFDTRNTGKIGFRELRNIADELGENIQDEEILAMIKEFDLDGDDAIGFDEFVGIMRSAY